MLYAGDDWAEDHHDVALVGEAGHRLARARLGEGVAGIARFHELIADQLPESDGPGLVVIGIETDRGPRVTALVACGYQVYAINPRSVSRYRERHSVSGAKSDAGNAWLLADLVRTDAARYRPVAGDSPRRGRDQGAGPGLPAADLGPSPQHAAAAQPAARVLPGGAGRLRRPARAGHPGRPHPLPIVCPSGRDWQLADEAPHRRRRSQPFRRLGTGSRAWDGTPRHRARSGGDPGPSQGVSLVHGACPRGADAIATAYAARAAGIPVWLQFRVGCSLVVSSSRGLALPRSG